MPKKNHPDYIPKSLHEFETGKKKPANYGVRSVVFLVVSLLGFFGGFLLLQNVVSFSLTNGLEFSAAYLYISTIVGALAFICWMTSLVLAGAGLAANRGSLGALMTVALNFLPVIFGVLIILTGWIPDALISGVEDLTNGLPRLQNSETLPGLDESLSDLP